ncbi:MAG: hypothetical protein OEX12_07140 [Gammaproteobacteria bacterium]|nr:hypothetical protein [Gammaproteobacteria bacterium]
MLWIKGRRILVISMFCLLTGSMVYADEQPSRMREDKTHIQIWNQFVTDILTLHEQMIVAQDIGKTSKPGGYASQPDFYIEEEYRDAQGRLLSRLQWERETPANLHAIELYIYDQRGRIIRDYAGAYLPNYRNAPTQTLLSLHNYSDQLHAFRTFDASADFLFERCSGRYLGKEVFISLDIDEKEALEGRTNTVMTSKAYAACFKGLAQTAGNFLQPQ